MANPESSSESEIQSEPIFHFSQRSHYQPNTNAAEYAVPQSTAVFGVEQNPEYFLHERKRHPEALATNGGLKRSDDRIRDEVGYRIMMEGEEDPRHLQIQVEKGVVTLEGRVDSQAARVSMERVCTAVPGVRSIRNHLEVS